MHNMPTPEYAWCSSEATHSHSYLMPLVSRYVASLPPGSRVLDLGCGNGATLARLNNRPLEFAGLELSAAGLALAREQNPGVEIEEADLTEDLSKHRWAGAFDLIISLEVVEHVFLPRVYARNCFTFLRPGGRLLVSTPYHGYLKNLALAASGKLDAHFTALWDYGHIKFWSRPTLTHLLSEAGFENISFHGTGRIPWLWKSMVLAADKPL